MTRRAAHLLVLFTASSAMLVGVPLLSVALAHDAWPDASVSAASPEYDMAGESRSESVEEEREEEVESKMHLFATRVAGESIDIRPSGIAAPCTALTRSGSRLSTGTSRGPPAA
jgi:hypothetical protein